MTTLAPYAAHAEQSQGRQHPEAPSGTRNAFQRDRDRIIHSTAFRRLEYKTQVFVNHEGDLFRTRLTHSLEVAQLARGIARTLRLHEDLSEAIALAHDLGHTPFGHAGQDALNACMKNNGGFEHNLQSLRVVDQLEQRYAEFDGLNLSFEVREGILKHCAIKNARSLGAVGLRFLNKTQPSLEAQLTNFADEIAYNNHDVDDGLRSGLITLEQLTTVELFASNLTLVQNAYPKLEKKRLIHETIRRMINTLVLDLCQHSTNNIQQQKIKHIQEVRHAPPLIGFSPGMAAQNRQLKQFLRHNLYQHPQVKNMSDRASHTVQALFACFSHNLSLLPPEFQASAVTDPARAVADYIAGMTDRFALREHRRLLE